MTRQASAIYEVGTDTIDRQSYGYLYPEGLDTNWKKRLEFVESASVDSPFARNSKFRHKAGHRVTSDPFPRTLVKEGPKRPVMDFEQTMDLMIVSDAFRICVEEVEPGVHQFEPVEVRWKDGSIAATLYYFIVCTDLDSIAADHVEGERKLVDYYGDGVQRLSPWRGASGTPSLRPNKMIFNLEAIGSHCIWQDGYLASNVLCSDVFKSAYEAANLVGAYFGQRRAI